MDPEIITGSIEVIQDDGTNESIVVRAATAADIPVLLRAVFGLDAPAEDTVPPDSPPTLAGMWDALTGIGMPAIVKIWTDPE